MYIESARTATRAHTKVQAQRAGHHAVGVNTLHSPATRTTWNCLFDTVTQSCGQKLRPRGGGGGGGRSLIALPHSSTNTHARTGCTASSRPRTGGT